MKPDISLATYTGHFNLLTTQVAARAWAEANSAAVQVAVRISLPLAGLLVAYEGSMESEELKP